MQELDGKFEMQGRQVVMIADNSPAHLEVSELKAINLQFLTANTTSCKQPIDQGLIRYVCLHFLIILTMECLDFVAKFFDYKDGSVRHGRKS